MHIQDCLKFSIHNCEDLFQTPLGKAFANLNNQGIKAYMNCGWESKEAIEIITSDNYYGEWVFFHEQNYNFLSLFLLTYLYDKFYALYIVLIHQIQTN